ncbi:MAG: outer membrane beta-barrel protein [Bacteroidales bacterium]|nr:outer membrane beta-barrel protein [Bacteroidales bacterium]
MKNKLFLILFLFGLFVCSTYAQEPLAYKSKWQLGLFSVGANMPITKLLQNTEADYILKYKDHSYYVQVPMVPSISYFFHKHWGINFNYRFGFPINFRNRTDDFIASVRSRHGSNYYINLESGDKGGIPDFGQVYVGVIYRFETDKFYVYPTFSIGMTSINTFHWQAHLKEKNSNNEYRHFLSANKGSSWGRFPTFAPSASFGYKLSKHIFLNADIMLSHFKTNIVSKKEFINLYTNESIVEYFDYKKDIFTLSLGVGLIFAF